MQVIRNVWYCVRDVCMHTVWEEDVVFMSVVYWQSLDKPVEDELYGLRVHSWVLVLEGKREIAEPFFIEPFTGLSHSVHSDKYLGIESIWNHQNYWVNMQECSEGVAVSITTSITPPSYCHSSIYFSDLITYYRKWNMILAIVDSLSTCFLVMRNHNCSFQLVMKMMMMMHIKR